MKKMGVAGRVAMGELIAQALLSCLCCTRQPLLVLTATVSANGICDTSADIPNIGTMRGGDDGMALLSNVM